MKLSFLGKSYDVTPNAIDGIETGKTLIYMGRQYKRKQYNVPASNQEPMMLTYMGRQYVR